MSQRSLRARLRVKVKVSVSDVCVVRGETGSTAAGAYHSEQAMGARLAVMLRWWLGGARETREDARVKYLTAMEDTSCV